MSEQSLKLMPQGPAVEMTGLRGLDEFNRAFASYLVWNKREQGQLIADRGKKVSIAIYKLYRKTAERNKTALREKIFADAGYAIKRRTDPDTGKTLTWAEEVNRRAGGVAVLATSWLHQRWRSNQAQGRHLRVNRRKKVIGSVLVDAGPGNENPSVTLTSYLQGAVAINQERHLVSQALYYQAADMAAYVRRKHQEALDNLFRQPFAVALSA